LGHAIALGRVRWRRADDQSGGLAEVARFVGRVAGCVVREPLDAVRCLSRFRAEPMLDGVRHQVTYELAGDGSRRRGEGHHLAIAAVQAEDDLYPFAVPTAYFEAVGAPAKVALERDDLAVVRASRFARVSFKQ